MTARFDSHYASFAASYSASRCARSVGTAMSQVSVMDTALMLAVSIFVILIGIIGRIMIMLPT